MPQGSSAVRPTNGLYLFFNPYPARASHMRVHFSVYGTPFVKSALAKWTAENVSVKQLQGMSVTEQQIIMRLLERCSALALTKNPTR